MLTNDHLIVCKEIHPNRTMTFQVLICNSPPCKLQEAAHASAPSWRGYLVSFAFELRSPKSAATARTAIHCSFSVFFFYDFFDICLRGDCDGLVERHIKRGTKNNEFAFAYPLSYQKLSILREYRHQL